MWKLYDEVALLLKKGLSYRVPILGASSNPQIALWIGRGGISGTYFGLPRIVTNLGQVGGS